MSNTKNSSTKNPLLQEENQNFIFHFSSYADCKKILKLWAKLSQEVSQLQECPLKKCVLVCTIHILVVHSIKFWLKTYLPQIHVHAKYQHYSYYGYKNIALCKKKGDTPKLAFRSVKYMFGA